MTKPNTKSKLYGMLKGDINQVMLNGSEIRMTAFRTLHSVSACILTHNDENSPEITRMMRALLMLHACFLIDLGLYPEEVADAIEDHLNRFDIVAGVPHRVNTGIKSVDEFVNAPFEHMEAENDD